MASKFVPFSPPLPLSNNHSTPSVNSIGPFSLLFPSARNPSGLSVHSIRDNKDVNLRAGNNRLRLWSLDAAPSSKSSTEKWEEEGLIMESLPDGKFKVKLSNGDMILGYLSGKIRQRFIRVMPGDKVKIEFSRYDLSKGRITYRLRKDRLAETEE